MGPFTHTAVGATLGVLSCQKIAMPFIQNTGESNVLLWAGFIGAIVGFLPDIDVLNKNKSYLYYMENHRKWTHSIFLHLLFSYAFAEVLSYTNIITSNGVFWTAICVFIVLLSHVLLDLFTSWGVYCFYPFIKKPYACKSVSVMDGFMSFVMMIQLLFLIDIADIDFIFSSFLQKIKVFFFQWKVFQTGYQLCLDVLYLPIGICFVYLVYNYFLRKYYIIPVFKDALAANTIAAQRIDIKPTFFNTILWTINVQTTTGYTIGYYSVFHKRDKVTFMNFEKNEQFINYDDPNLLAVIERFSKAVDNWYSFTNHKGFLYINDVRYGFKSANLKETVYAQPYLICPKKQGDLDVKLQTQIGSFVKLFKRFFYA